MRVMLRILAAAMLGGVAGAALMGVSAPWSPSGWFGLGAMVVAALALWIKERGARRSLGVVAAILFAILLIVRVVGASDGMIRLVTLPQGSSSTSWRWLGSVVD